MTILPRIRSKFGEQVGVEVFIQPPDIAENEKTFIITDANSGVSAFSVDNGLKFGVGEYLLVGNFGAEKTEIARIHTSTTPTATTVTLNAATNFAHARGVRLQTISYDQIVIQRSIDAGVSYSDLVTVDIRADATETYYNDTTGTSAYYYRAKFKNSATVSVSENSDGVLSTGFAENSAGAIIRDALISMGETMDNEVLTKEFLLRALDEGRDEIDMHQNIERWSFRTSFDYDAGDIIPGTNSISLPTDLRESSTQKNLLSIRLGRDNLPLSYVDKRALNNNYRGVAHSTVASILNDSDVTVTLTSSGDFDEAGSINVSAPNASGLVDAIAYTSNSESTGVLSGVTGIVAGGHAVGADVWQGVSFGHPTEFSIYEGKVVFSQPFDDRLGGESVWMDYYKKKVVANSDGDLLDEPFYRIYLPYMRYRIKLRKNAQMVRDEDDDYKAWVEKREAQVAKEYSGQDMRITVDVPDNNLR